MEADLGEGWGDLGFGEICTFLAQPEADDLLFIAMAIDAEDEADIGHLGEIIRTARARDVRVILVADGVSPATLHQLLRMGACDFLPYPLAEGALHDAIEKMRTAPETGAAPQPDAIEGPSPARPVEAGPSLDGDGAIFAVQNLAGGTGASTLAVNLAWELAVADKKKPPTVCLLDLDLQYGSAATYLDLPRRDVVVELLQEAQSMDVDAFRQALVSYGDKLSVFTAPPEILPLDIIGPQEVDALLTYAQQCFDIVIVDMPRSIVMWTETILNRSDIFFATLELDLRSAQDAMRFIKALRSEDLPLEKVQYVLNRAPGMTDLAGKSRAKKMSESLGVEIATHLPEGGKPVMAAGDNGQPLAEACRKNPLRKEIAKLAGGLFTAMVSDAVSAKKR
ncbi:Type II/IV secretion system ATPase TadZ/CpaE, associated with Flp pilus assembly [Roseibacterium elongatum DSM 19469]|uniref:Type II/IV secretion system ATPase TadZ/CpaE, associated with Flp pilus assembly n=2 Tax=Roseicyclus elongatus TaxID=159346 RepID=W8RSR9_9RHOB|nr:Type II/IV secretion system ATPase TadZ/CpaE, associated with Flp pilus assembly [Roseibacterium elongatum DSM 19469]